MASWTVLVTFDFTPDNDNSTSIHVEPDDVVTEEQCNPTRAAIFVDLGLMVANP